jgi:tRNA A-37 threonylcarbamoyl transferase component Bud32
MLGAMGEPAQARGRSVLAVVLPRFDEPPPPVEFYRFVGKLRVVVISLLVTMNLLTGLGADDDTLPARAYWLAQIPNTALLGVDLLLSWILWRRARTRAQMRRLVIAGAVLECLSTMLMGWFLGSSNSHMYAFALVIIILYRVAFDLRVGLIVLGTLFAVWWAVVIAEVAGWIPAQLANVHGVDYVYTDPARQVGSMVFLSVIFLVTFVVANWAVARLRHKDRAIRILREALAASEAGALGRHTGRILSGTYQVGGLIAAGGMGEVYRGHHQRTRRPVAIKLLHPHLVDDALLLRRFRREAEITATLGSRNIVEVIDVDIDDGHPYLVLELLEGEDLMARIARAPLPLELVGEVVDQLADGLAVAHEAGVVHRDLKPENVFLAGDPAGLVVKILDFGVSKIRTSATAITQEVALLGTPDFMAPEQAVGVTDEVGPAADIFATGGIVYCALTGRRPFTGASVPAVLRRICDEEPVPVRELRPEVPEAVEQVLAIAMAKDPAQRYTSARELAADLRAASTGAAGAELAQRAAAVRRAAPASRSVVGDASVNPSAPTAAGVDHPDAVSDTLAPEELARRTSQPR